jgi:hypothetical protein
MSRGGYQVQMVAFEVSMDKDVVGDRTMHHPQRKTPLLYQMPLTLQFPLQQRHMQCHQHQSIQLLEMSLTSKVTGWWYSILNGSVDHYTTTTTTTTDGQLDTQTAFVASLPII